MPNTADTFSKKTPRPAIRAYLGGSFDPVHKGHVQMAMIVYQHLLPIAEEEQRDLHVSLLPNARSPFKTHSTDPAHRLAMLKLATQETPIQINELELWQAPPVYTIDSVRTLRQRYPNDSLIFIMGMDSARSLDQWKEGLRLTDSVNLWIFSRVGMSDMQGGPDETNNGLTANNVIAQETMALPDPLKSLIIGDPTELIISSTQNLTASNHLKNVHQGHIYIDSRSVVAVSSTQIREQLQSMGRQADIISHADTQITAAMPINAIMSHTIPNPFAKWLNPAVYHYIIAHQLYSGA
ncbi:nicotinate-nicotinamide nucleotide adenylyltransferase [Psychrobacter sp. B38]|uniref:nicotinate-nicotinamide nucleotide adenylyltransferase n=1 Tax=Psychrobacter sp. B38 TaxID=3143538 RepID=UPI00320EA4AD